MQPSERATEFNLHIRAYMHTSCTRRSSARETPRARRRRRREPRAPHLLPPPAMATSALTPSRLGALKALQCALFQTSYNPSSARTGAKYLRARLRGPSLVAYYPRELRLADLRKSARGAEFLVDEDEEERIQDVEDKKARGKGAPPKAKNKGARAAASVLPVLTAHPRRRESAREPQAVVVVIYIRIPALCYAPCLITNTTTRARPGGGPPPARPCSAPAPGAPRPPPRRAGTPPRPVSARTPRAGARAAPRPRPRRPP
jgi:small subunit ribosomal protein S33